MSTVYYGAETLASKGMRVVMHSFSSMSTVSTVYYQQKTPLLSSGVYVPVECLGWVIPP